MAKAKFDRKKPHLNVGTIGHVDHGKTTLTPALTKVMGDKWMATYITYYPVDNASDSQGRRNPPGFLTTVLDQVERPPESRNYSQVASPGTADTWTDPCFGPRSQTWETG